MIDVESFQDTHADCVSLVITIPAGRHKVAFYCITHSGEHKRVNVKGEDYYSPNE